MGKIVREIWGIAFARHSVRVAWIIAIILLIVGYFTPPVGDMPEWVMKGVGWAFAYAGLSSAVGALEQGLEAHVKKGDMELHIGKDRE